MDEPTSEPDAALQAFLNAGQPNLDAVPDATCPMCGATNSGLASECEACGEPLNPVFTETGVWRDGKLLVMNRSAKLPYRCIVTNADADLWIPKNIATLEEDASALFLIGRMFGLPMFMQTAYRLQIQIPVSEPIAQRSRRFKRAAWIIAGVGGTLILLGVLPFLVFSGNPDHPAMAFGMAGTIVLTITCVFCHSAGDLLTSTKVTTRFIWLKGAHPDYLATLPEWRGG